MTGVHQERYRALIEARVHDPGSLLQALVERRRRPLVGPDGRLLIIAADHTARGMLAAGDDPLAVADRRTLLDRLVRALAMPGVDGVLASADILEELAWLGALDERLAIGTMNRGGIIGARWELDDRMTAYDADHVADLGIVSLIEPLPYRTDDTGRAMLDPSDDALTKVVAIASGLGSTSSRTWLKIPGSDRMEQVAGATSLPILMLGGDPGTNADRVFGRWEAAMQVPNVRGLVAGRALLYPHGREVEEAVAHAARIVHGGAA